jgi:uncharacterized protein YndB with AHSA1/START domain
MSDTAETDAIIVEYAIDATPDNVWRALTERELIQKWLMETTFEPTVGHRFTFKAQPQPWWDGIVHCEVLEVDRPNRLSYSWKGGAGEFALDTVVTWTIAPNPNGGSHVTLEHKGFRTTDQFAIEGMGKGWRGHIGAALASVAAEL